jgi:hypothetical protein
VDDVDLYLLGRQFDERVAKGLDRAIGVALDDDVEFVELAACDACEISLSVRRVCVRRLCSRATARVVGDVAYLLLSLEHVELITGVGAPLSPRMMAGSRGASSIRILRSLNMA